MAEKTAQELVKDLSSATEEEAKAILQEEQERGEEQRVTVVRAAEERLAVLAVPGEPQEGTPEGVWAQLLDADGKPVLVDGSPVRTELTP